MTAVSKISPMAFETAAAYVENVVADVERPRTAERSEEKRAVAQPVSQPTGNFGANIKTQGIPLDQSEKLTRALIQKNVIAKNVQLQFEVEPDSERVIIKVLDRDSGELIRQIPPEEVVKLSKLLDNAKGNLVDGVT